MDVALVRRLLAGQAPELAHRVPVFAAEGWDNVTYRLGPDLAVRLPRRAAAVPLIVHEQTWLATVAAGLSVAVPRVVVRGRAGPGYPWPWSVVAWVEGRPADRAPLNAAAAPVLARELRAVHAPAPHDAPSNPFRGMHPAGRSDAVRARLDRFAADGHAFAEPLRAVWERAAAAPPDPDRVWLHGDLHPGNVIVRDGALSGLIDWGDLTAGDRATDLVAGWLLFSRTEEREAFFDAYGADEPARTRASGWAVNFVTGILASGDPRHRETALAVLGRLTA
ncbi:MAG: aminoglycoside phosphotransferase family protein [Longimicrobiales bacterium]